MSKSSGISSGCLALVAALAAIGIGEGSAQAADYLRGHYAGSQEPRAASGADWAGVYAGVHGGASSAEVDASKFSSALADSALPNSVHRNILRDTINFKSTNKVGVSYGGFVGMNMLWDDVVLGVEVDYTHSSIRANSNIGPYGLYTDTAGVRNGVSNVVSSARGEVKDWGTIRGRIGYAMGNFMPYITAGLALGNVNSRATTSGTWYTQSLSTPAAFPTISGTFSGVTGRRGIAYGTAMGAGVDMQLIPGMFLRAEYQFVQFADGAKRPQVSINTARLGGGIKF